MPRIRRQPQALIAAAVCFVVAAVGLFVSLNPGSARNSFLLGIAVALVMGMMGIGFALSGMGVLPERKSNDPRK